MKKTNFFNRFGMVALLVCAAVSTTLLTASCSDDEISDGPESVEVLTEDDYLPPTDSMKVKTVARAYVFPGNYDNTGEALVKRITNNATTLEASVKTVILHDKSVAALLDNDYRGIAAHIARGGSVVYCEPTSTGVNVFSSKLKTIGLEMYNAGELTFTEAGYSACRKIMLMDSGNSAMMFPPTGGDGDSPYDLVAFRGNDLYTVNSTDDDDAVIYTSISEDGFTPAENSVGTEKPDEIPEEYLAGLHADNVAHWLDNPKDEAAMKAKGRELMTRADGGTAKLSELMDAQQKVYAITAYAGHKFCTVKIVYNIWAVNDTHENDYYLCNQEIQANCSELKCGPSSGKVWDKYKTYEAFKGLGSDISAYWAYFKGLSVQPTLLDSNGKAVPDNMLLTTETSPTNKIGEETYTRTTKWNLDVAFVASGSHSLKGGIEVTESSSYKVPTIQLNWTRNGNSPKWEYSTPVLPKSQCPKVKTHSYEKDKKTVEKGKKRDPNFSWLGLICTHDEAKPIMRQDFTLGHTWLWKVSKANGQYRLRTNFSITLQGLYYDDASSKYHDFKNNGRYKDFTTTKTEDLALNCPPRFEQKWLMVLDTDSSYQYNEQLSSFMKQYFNDNWNTAFDLYTVTEDDRKLVDARINALIKDINANQAWIQDQKVPKFRLDWKLKDDTKVYRSYTYVPK